jgi:hypothetical protein
MQELQRCLSGQHGVIMPKWNHGILVITLLIIACSSGASNSTPVSSGSDAGLNGGAPQSSAASTMQGGSGGASSGDMGGGGGGGGGGLAVDAGEAPKDLGIASSPDGAPPASPDVAGSTDGQTGGSGGSLSDASGGTTMSRDARADRGAGGTPVADAPVGGGGSSGGAGGDAAITPDGYGLPPGSSIKVLWIGNSLTGAPEAMGAVTNWAPMPDRLVPMLAELGIAMTYGSVIQGGAEFSAHAANPTAMAEIANPTYDIVNFQSSYDDAGDAAAYTTAVRPLYTAAHNAGAIALFEGIWEFGGFGSYELDYGGPVDPAAENAVEGAAAALPGSFPVQVGHCWKAVKNRSAALIPKMHDDGVHQSVLGEYFNSQ